MYRRRRISVALAVVVAIAAVAAVVDTAGGGTAGRTVLERVVAVAVVVLWARCALALWHSNRAGADSGAGSDSVSGVESGASCLAPGSAPVLSSLPRP